MWSIALRIAFDGLRHHWTLLHPSVAFDGRIDLVVDPATKDDLALALRLLAADSGFARAHVNVGAAEWDSPIWTADKVMAGERTRLTNVLVKRAGAAYAIAAKTPGPPCAHASATGDGATLRAIVSDRCADVESCIVALEPSGDTMANVAAILAPAFGPGAPANVALDVSALPVRYHAIGVEPCYARGDPPAEVDLPDGGRR